MQEVGVEVIITVKEARDWQALRLERRSVSLSGTTEELALEKFV
jgi:hypothetical protein